MSGTDDPVGSDDPAGSDDPIGRVRWAVPAGHVPVDSTGPEPEMVSHDALSVLNAGDEMANVEVTLTYAGGLPVEDDSAAVDGATAGPYKMTVAPRRVRRVRVNDLIDPFAPPLGEDYAAVVESDVPVVVQFARQDTRRAEAAWLSTVAYSE